MRKGKEFLMKRVRKEGLHKKFKAESYMPNILNFKNFRNFISFRDSLYLKVSQKVQILFSLPSSAHVSTGPFAKWKADGQNKWIQRPPHYALIWGKRRVWYLAFGLADWAICSCFDLLLFSSGKPCVLSFLFLVDFCLVVLTSREVAHGKIRN